VDMIRPSNWYLSFVKDVREGVEWVWNSSLQNLDFSIRIYCLSFSACWLSMFYCNHRFSFSHIIIQWDWENIFRNFLSFWYSFMHSFLDFCFGFSYTLQIGAFIKRVMERWQIILAWRTSQLMLRGLRHWKQPWSCYWISLHMVRHIRLPPFLGTKY